MNIPYVQGVTPKQAHVSIPDGTVEEEIGRNGFFGKYAHLYRAHPPTAWSRIEGNLKPRAFDLNRIEASGDFIQGRKPFLSNQDVSLQFVTFSKPMSYFFRNADGDDLFFVHGGTGRLETDYGVLNYRKGDYLLIPRGTLYRFEPKEASSFLVIESFSEVGFPEKGMLGQHALFDPAVVEIPLMNGAPISSMDGSQSEYEVRIKRNQEITRVFYPFCPLDSVGWKGTLSVLKINVEDIRPVLSDRYHLPPSAHTTFVANQFVVCSFLPRPLEVGDEKALRVPFYHSNIDFDEVIFYHAGEFFSRSGILEGMVTFHPQGIQHGPQKKAVERSREAKYTNEIAVMIDTKRPLQVSGCGASFENQDYWKSWQS